MIFQSANEMANNVMIREKIAEIQARGKETKERWEKEKENVKAEFLKELDEEEAEAAADKTASDEDAVLVDGGGPGATGSATAKAAKKRKGKK